MHFEKSYLPAFTVVGIACQASDARPEAKAELWRRVRREKMAKQILERASDAVYALYCDYESDHTGVYTYVLGYEVPSNSVITEDPPKGMVVAVVPAARYAVIEARGKQPETLMGVWDHVLNSALARTYVCDFEIHWGPVAIEVHIGIA